LPDLSKSRNLEELELSWCERLELHERDIEMLSELPLLQPVLWSGWWDVSKLRLDVVRRKWLIYPYIGGEEERDVGALPIVIRYLYRDYFKRICG